MDSSPIVPATAPAASAYIPHEVPAIRSTAKTIRGFIIGDEAVKDKHSWSLSKARPRELTPPTTKEQIATKNKGRAISNFSGPKFDPKSGSNHRSDNPS